jgi:hypothetical protein
LHAARRRTAQLVELAGLRFRSSASLKTADELCSPDFTRSPRRPLPLIRLLYWRTTAKVNHFTGPARFYLLYLKDTKPETSTHDAMAGSSKPRETGGHLNFVLGSRFVLRISDGDVPTVFS